MKSLQTIEEMLEHLKPGMTVDDLAKNMCDPFWQANQFLLRDEMVEKITEMRKVSARALSEIQHKLVDEFVESLESPDKESQREVMEFMAEFIPLETRRGIAAAVLENSVGKSETQGEESRNDLRHHGIRPRP